MSAEEDDIIMDESLDDDSDPEDLEDEDPSDDDDEMQEGGSSANINPPAAPAPVQQPAPEEDAAIARRRAIQEVMRNTSLSEQEKRMRIQNIMSGGRTEVMAAPAPSIPQPEANAACVHYERNCNIVAPCCNRVFGCRICHDELSPCRLPMNRFMVQEVVCKNCATRQRASNQCVNCQTIFGEYHCGVCNLWMSMVRKCKRSAATHKNHESKPSLLLLFPFQFYFDFSFHSLRNLSTANNVVSAVWVESSHSATAVNVACAFL